MDEYPRSYELTLGLEGGRDLSGLLVYSNLVGDAGGPTVAGLALLTSGIVTLDRDKDGKLDFDLNNDGKVDVADMLQLRNRPEQHREFFRNEYWLKVSAHMMTWPWCALAYDAAVHHGVGTAIKLVQESVGSEPDGVVGTGTLSHVRTAGSGRTKRYLALRARLFRAIDDRRRAKNQNSFFEAWMNRLASLMYTTWTE